MRRFMRNIHSVKLYPTGGNRENAHQRLQQCGLAHAVVAQNPNDLTFFDREVNPMQYGNTTVACVQITNIKDKCVTHWGLRWPR